MNGMSFVHVDDVNSCVCENTIALPKTLSSSSFECVNSANPNVD